MAATRVNTQDIFDGGVKVNDIDTAAVTFPKLNLSGTNPGIINDGADGIRAKVAHKDNFLTGGAPSANNQMLVINSAGNALDWVDGGTAYPPDEAQGLTNVSVSGTLGLAAKLQTNGGLAFDGTSGGIFARSRQQTSSGAPSGVADGDAWYDQANGTEYFRASGIQHGISASGNSAIANSTAIANTVTETVLSGSTYNVPVGYARVRRVFRLTAWGFYSTTGTPNLQFRVRADTGLTLSPAQGGNLTTISGASSRVWMVRSTMIVNVAGAGGNMSGMIESSVDNNVYNVRSGFASIDWTSTKQLSLTATWGTASASNTVTMERCLWEILN